MIWPLVAGLMTALGPERIARLVVIATFAVFVLGSDDREESTRCSIDEPGLMRSWRRSEKGMNSPQESTGTITDRAVSPTPSLLLLVVMTIVLALSRSMLASSDERALISGVRRRG